MNILGVSCFYHDSAACLIRDGKVIAAASEERFNRKKNCSDFPINAINFCLQAGGITVYDLDCIGFYEKPFLKFQRVVVSHLLGYPFSFGNFLATMPHWLKDRLIIPAIFKNELGSDAKVLFVKHHLSHAASSFLVSPFEEAAILTSDGVGEWATMTSGYCRGTSIKILKEMYYPNSLGLFYTALTTYLGFEALEGEGKVMGLAGYGKPVYIEKFKDMIAVREDGNYKIDQRYFGFNKGSRMYSRRFIKTFGEERKQDGLIDQRHCDIAASLQKFVEDILILIARNLYDSTKIDKLCLGGGVFLNCVANQKIIENTPFKELYIQPAAGDSGGALGVAAYLYHSVFKKPRVFPLKDVFLGPDFSSKQIKTTLINKGINFKEMEDTELSKHIAQKIQENKIIGWFQGRMEFGPRALGNRSILANPCNPKMKELLNSRVKGREGFRPYAPAILEERVGDFFEAKQFSPFMLISALVKEEKRNVVPAITHVDGSARVQIVSKETNPKFWSLIKEFDNLTGIPIVINTSFNLKGEPIVCGPDDALKDFLGTQMDVLVLNNFVLEK